MPPEKMQKQLSRFGDDRPVPRGGVRAMAASSSATAASSSSPPKKGRQIDDRAKAAICDGPKATAADDGLAAARSEAEAERQRVDAARALEDFVVDMFDCG